MVRTTEIQKKAISKNQKFTPEDLPKIRQMVKEVRSGMMSQIEASQKYKVTRHQVRKWLDIFQQTSFSDDPNAIDEVLKQKIVREIIENKLTQREAVKKYKVPFDVISRILKSCPGFSGTRTGINLRASSEIADEKKMEVVRKIQSGELSQFQVANQLRVTRYSVRTWISNYSMFNLDGSICYQMLQNMTEEEKNKQLIEQIAELKKQLENEKLKTESLQTLIEVAEEKFGIKIKKKHGSKPPQK
jgi:transposase